MGAASHLLQVAKHIGSTAYLFQHVVAAKQSRSKPAWAREEVIEDTGVVRLGVVRLLELAVNRLGYWYALVSYENHPFVG